MKIRASSIAAQELLQAAADGRLADLQRYLQRAAADPSTLVCSSGCTALHWAAGAGHAPIVDYLLQLRNEELGRTAWFLVDCPAVQKSQGRTALHYACRNGHVHVVRQLIEQYGADPNAKARHGVTPLQMAVWQGRLQIARYLVHRCGVDPRQINDFDCGLVHWMGLAPLHAPAVDMAKWLYQEVGLPMEHVVQRQGHSALHKAAWGGHLDLCQYLHEKVGLWDDRPDAVGNYAVDLARMAQHNKVLIDYLQRVASRATLEACQLLDVSRNVHERTVHQIQKAYRSSVRACHPDGKEKRRRRWENVEISSSLEFELEEDRLVQRFQLLTKAYQHLMVCESGGDDDDDKLLHNHATHKLPLLLTQDGSIPDLLDDECFEARLLQVVKQNQKGLDLSNLLKKWNQVWPEVPFPSRAHISLQQFLRQKASRVVSVGADDNGVLRIYPKTTRV